MVHVIKYAFLSCASPTFYALLTRYKYRHKIAIVAHEHAIRHRLIEFGLLISADKIRKVYV